MAKTTDNIRLQELAHKWLTGTLDKDEQREFDEWFMRVSDTPLEVPSSGSANEYDHELFRKIQRQINVGRKRKSVSIWRRVAAAAVLIMALAGAWIFFGDQIVDQKSNISNLQSEDIAPGTNRATLTLADGRTVDLSSEQSGIVVGDEDITYQDGTSLALSPAGEPVPPGTEKGSLITNYYVLTTPKGGTYQLTLSDGTKVWLNAGSTLKYPSRFSGEERVVELIGEAFFEVESINILGDRQGNHAGKKDMRESVKSASSVFHKLPFKVITNGQTVEVLGTQFNISAYPDDPETKTTLVEGKVQVALSPAGEPVPNSLREGRGRSVVLQPGTQSSTGGADINISKVDVSPYIAWKDGLFHFDGTVPQDAFGQLSRWYDLEVAYEGKRPTVRFYGMIGRDKSLASVLGILQESGLGFRIEKASDKNKLIVVTE
ncbi:FecR family protein [Parapedobacter tibetensis]|uniref:FecR family protein n=1 Tax=Parapedobacter tibetensis TaxID=2972951 RepID=UPI00214DEAC7|nr:FecR family protein [Parapedobacter tibetensis]